MDQKERTQRLIKCLEPLNQFLGIGLLTVMRMESGNLSPAFSHIFCKDFPAIAIDKLLASNAQLKERPGAALTLKLKSDTNADIYCLAAPLPGDGLMVLQGTPPANALQEQVLACVTDLYRLAEESALGAPPSADSPSDPYRREINKLREMQAKLFPKFEGLPGLDVTGVLLPAAIMSGNFVDAFFVDESVYQIALCEVAGGDASSSFMGSAIRTLMQADAGHRMVPSALIESINTKLRRIIPGISTIAGITVCQINIRTGQITISSTAAPPVVLFSGKRSGAIHLQQTEAGQILAKRQGQRDIQLKLSEGDSLVIYSRGICASEAENGSESYGERRLMDTIVENGEGPIVELLHAVIESIYEYTDYGPQKDDYILLGLRKPRTEPRPEPRAAAAADAKTDGARETPAPSGKKA